MNRLTRIAPSLLVLALALTSVGCAGWNTVQNTQITVQVSGERMLHMATLPRELPGGRPAAEAREALLEDLAEVAGGYTLIEDVMGGWKPEDAEEVIEERNNLLLVAGPAGLGPMLKQRLVEDFEQESPFVISLPIQSIRVIRPTPADQRPPTKVTSAE